jgi:acyl-CoA dehydrogenase
MSDDNAVLEDAFRRLVGDTVTPERIRRAEAGSAREPIWGELVASGFLDALVPEAAGGAGLTFAQAFPLILTLGAHAAPVPFAETMVARGLLAGRAQLPDNAAIILAAPSPVQPYAAMATHALIEAGDTIQLVVAQPSGDDVFNLAGALAVTGGAVIAAIPAAPGTLLNAAAATASAQMAGAMMRMLEMTLNHANDRQQFGRPLGKFQAIQHELAVMAEQVIAAQVASRTAFSGPAFDVARVAAAKCRTNEAAHQVCAIAHAVHGAIGATAEFDLQLYSRRIKQWQLAYGSESYWARRLGRIRAASGSMTSADFIREHLACAVA